MNKMFCWLFAVTMLILGINANSYANNTNQPPMMPKFGIMGINFAENINTAYKNAQDYISNKKYPFMFNESYIGIPRDFDYNVYDGMSVSKLKKDKYGSSFSVMKNGSIIINVSGTDYDNTVQKIHIMKTFFGKYANNLFWNNKTQQVDAITSDLIRQGYNFNDGYNRIQKETNSAEFCGHAFFMKYNKNDIEFQYDGIQGGPGYMSDDIYFKGKKGYYFINMIVDDVKQTSFLDKHSLSFAMDSFNRHFKEMGVKNPKEEDYNTAFKFIDESYDKIMKYNKPTIRACYYFDGNNSFKLVGLIDYDNGFSSTRFKDANGDFYVQFLDGGPKASEKELNAHKNKYIQSIKPLIQKLDSIQFK